MKKNIIAIIVCGGLLTISSCEKDEECVCENSANLTEIDAKDIGVTLETACELAKNGDESCKIE